MSMYFEKEKIAKFQFLTNHNSSEKTTLDGINASLSSAEIICNGVDSLMAIGGNTPYYDGEAKRTVVENVYDNYD